MRRRPPSAPCAAAASASGGAPGVSRSTPSASSRRRRASTRGDGHASSATQRPGISSIHGTGGVASCIQTRSIGSSITPVSMPLSQKSHQRSASCRKPMAGPGRRVVGEGVRPRADQTLARPGKSLEQAQDAVGVAVGPAAHGVDGDLDGAVVLADRTVFPVGVATLVREPGMDPRPVGGEALLPQLAPACADRRLVRRLALPVQHARAPVEQVGGEHAAALVVDVVGVAVVGAHQGDDRLERRRASGGQLEAVEATPRDAGHADASRTPRLGGDPGDDLEEVLLLLGVVLVLEDPVRLATAAEVDAHAGVAARRPVRVDDGIAGGHAVAQPVGHGLQDGRYRVGLGVGRQPDAGGEARAVAQRDPHVVQLADLAKHFVALGHRRPPRRLRGRARVYRAAPVDGNGAAPRPPPHGRGRSAGARRGIGGRSRRASWSRARRSH